MGFLEQLDSEVDWGDYEEQRYNVPGYGDIVSIRRQNTGGAEFYRDGVLFYYMPQKYLLPTQQQVEEITARCRDLFARRENTALLERTMPERFTRVQ